MRWFVLVILALFMAGCQSNPNVDTIFFDPHGAEKRLEAKRRTLGQIRNWTKNESIRTAAFKSELRRVRASKTITEDQAKELEIKISVTESKLSQLKAETLKATAPDEVDRLMRYMRKLEDEIYLLDQELMGIIDRL